LHRRRAAQVLAVVIQALIALAVLIGGLAVRAEEPAPRYERVAPSADGIGVRYMGREIAQVMTWEGAAWLERPEREQEERTDLLLVELALVPGMTIADVGAGTGYVARRMAREVGSTGVVYAVDLQPQMIEMLTALAQRENLSQIRPVLSSVDDVRLPPASVDLAIMVDVYHELEYPYEVLASIVRALKPGGRVVFVEYRAEDRSVPIKRLHKMSIAQVQREAEPHPLVFERVAHTLPWQHIIVFRKR
jgi:SAM-dependent methyltransferase